MTGTIATRQNGNGIAPMNLDPMTVARAFKASGMFPDLASEAQAIVKIVAGQEVGFGPMASMQAVQMIQGKPTFSANALAALVKRHPSYNYRTREHTAEVCRLEFFEDGEPCGVSEFTIEDAKTAGIAGGQNWRKYPKAMLFARALSQGVRWYAPDVTAGSAAYVPEELGGDEPDTRPADTAEQPQAEPEAEEVTGEVVHAIDAERVEVLANGFRAMKLTLRDIDELLNAAGIAGLRARSKQAVTERLASLTPDEADKLEAELEKEADRATA